MNLKKFKDENGKEFTIANELKIDGIKYIITIDKIIFIQINEDTFVLSDPKDANIIGIKKMLSIPTESLDNI